MVKSIPKELSRQTKNLMKKYEVGVGSRLLKYECVAKHAQTYPKKQAHEDKQFSVND